MRGTCSFRCGFTSESKLSRKPDEAEQSHLNACEEAAALLRLLTWQARVAFAISCAEDSIAEKELSDGLQRTRKRRKQRFKAPNGTTKKEKKCARWLGDLYLDRSEPADKIKRLSKQLDGDCAPVRSFP